jgi:hypothetical protein
MERANLQETTNGALFLAALGARAMREFRRSAIFADEQPLLLHSQMRPAPAGFAFGMMLGWYASHGNLYV